MPPPIVLGLLLVWLVAGMTNTLGDPIALVRVGDSWSFIPAADDPGPPGEPEPSDGWIGSLEYDTTHWLRGVSGFTTPEAADRFTPLNLAPGANGTVRFRAQFTLEDPAAIKLLALRAKYENGFIAWLNGVEVVRANVPVSAGAVPAASQPITDHRLAPAEEFDLSGQVGLLRTGTNLLSIQYHAGPPQYPFALLVPELFANFTRAPVLLNISSNQTLVHWKTIRPTDGAVELGAQGLPPRVFQSEGLGTNHYALVTGLTPGTAFQYRVVVRTGALEAASPTYTSRTLSSENGAIQFTVVGDTGFGYLPQYLVAKRLKLLGGDFVLHLGDQVYPSLTADMLDLRVFSIYGPFNGSLPFLYTAGNHESYNGGRPVYQSVFRPRTEAVDGSSLYYSFDHGCAHFVLLDTDTQAQARYDPGSPQYQWLENDLASSTKPWKLLFFHHIIRSSSIHQLDDYNLDAVADTKAVQDSIGRLAAKYGVQLIMTGHDHDYERFAPFEGIVTLVSGGGGASIYPMQTRAPGSSQYWPRHHCVQIDMDETRLRARAVDVTGEVFDEFNIQRAPPAARALDATWATPAFPAQAANDTDGNVIGQRFTLSGPARPTALGRFSGLGDVYFNNDAEFLYAGFARSMLQAGQSVFLFLGNPLLPGVATMAGLGNGLVDPEGQGADGLDFLENLSFTNFAPTIGCILGNEVADFQSRNFIRPLQGFQPGQGAFFLDAGFSDVPRVRLQQFNRSPQIYPEREDEIADFIQIALPLNVLGVGPGGILKVGAVVGLAVAGATADNPTRELDTGVLGSAFLGSSSNTVWLEPLLLRLATNPVVQADFSLAISAQNPSQAQISWAARPGQKYTLQTAATVDGPFVNHPGAISLAVEEPRAIKLLENLPQTTQFYRLVSVQ